MGIDFQPPYNKWGRCRPSELFEKPIVRSVPEGKKQLEQQPAAVVGAIRCEDDDSADPEEFTNVNRGPPLPRLVPPAPFFRCDQRDLWHNYRNLFTQFALFNTWIAAYDQVMIIVPYALAAPLMFASNPANRITLGTLMQVSNAFDKVFGAMAVVSENWSAVNDFRSTVYRLREFERHTYQRKRFDHTLLRGEPELPEMAVPEPLACDATAVELAEPKRGGPRHTNGTCTRIESGCVDD